MVYPYKFKKWRGKPRRKSGTLKTGRVYKYRGKSTIYKPPAGVHAFVRTVQFASSNFDATGNKFQAFTFALSDLPNYSEFTNLYDQFQIVAVKFEIIPKFNAVDLNPMSTWSQGVLPNIHSVLDYNDSTAPTSLTEMMQYKNYRRSRGNQIHKRYFKPATLSQNYESAVSTSYTSKWKDWISTDDPTTPYYCIKVCWDACGVVEYQPTYDIYAKYYFQCKSTK